MGRVSHSFYRGPCADARQISCPRKGAITGGEAQHREKGWLLLSLKEGACPTFLALFITCYFTMGYGYVIIRMGFSRQIITLFCLTFGHALVRIMLGKRDP